MQGLPKVCVFCGGDESTEELNAEHFVPQSLWEGPRPQYTQTVPAHVSCNRSFSIDVDDFRDFLALSAHASEHPEVKRLLEGKLGRKIAKRASVIEKKTRPVVGPNFDARGQYRGQAVFMQIDMRMVVRVVQNMARGLYFSSTKSLLPRDARIAVVILDDSNAHVEELVQLVVSLGKTESFGDDVFRYRFQAEPGSFACVFDFYKAIRFLAYAVWDVDPPPSPATAT